MGKPNTLKNSTSGSQINPRTPKRKRHKNIQGGVTIENRFDALQNLDNDEFDSEYSSDSDEAGIPQQTGTRKERKVKIPPIIITQAETKEQGNFLQLVRSLAKDKDCKIFYKNKQYKVHCTSLSSFNSLLAGLQETKSTYETLGKDLSFYTHEFAHEKSKRIVLKGLPILDVAEIKSEICDNDVICESVILLAKKDLVNNTRPIYLVTLDKSVDLQDVRAIKFLHSVKVNWDKYKNRNKTTQCHRCQRFGHGSIKCFAAPRCLHCGEDHLTKVCIKKGLVTKCCNCGKEHRANSRECEMYAKRVNAITSKRPPKPIPKKRPDVPPPTPRDFPTPIWSIEDKDACRETTPAWVNTRYNHTDNEMAKDFEELASTMKNIGELIDVKKMLSMFKTLESKLRLCVNEREKFATFFSFLANYGP